MNRRVARLLAMLVATLVAAACARPSPPGEEYRVQARLARDGDHIVMAFRNISKSPICMADIRFSDSDRSGMFVYLYDPVARDLQASFALVYWAPDAVAECRWVKPGESRTGRFRIQHVLRYFSRVPECFYLVTVYRKRSESGLVASKPSEPVRICKGSGVAGVGATSTSVPAG